MSSKTNTENSGQSASSVAITTLYDGSKDGAQLKVSAPGETGAIKILSGDEWHYAARAEMRTPGGAEIFQRFIGYTGTVHQTGTVMSQSEGINLMLHLRIVGDELVGNVEVYSDDEDEYADMGLEFDGWTLTGYDGAFELPFAVGQMLSRLGVTIEESVFDPQPPFVPKALAPAGEWKVEYAADKFDSRLDMCRIIKRGSESHPQGPIVVATVNVCAVAPHVEHAKDTARKMACAPELVTMLDNCIVAMEQALPVINSHRAISGGEGDISAMNFRFLINSAKSLIATAKGGFINER